MKSRILIPSVLACALLAACNQPAQEPAASAGAALRVIIAAGKFHGVMAATTPIGSLLTTMRASPLWLGMVSP